MRKQYREQTSVFACPLTRTKSFFKKDFLYFFMRDTEREAKGEAGSLQGAQCGT